MVDPPAVAKCIGTRLTAPSLRGVAIRSLTDHVCHQIGALTPMGEDQGE
jgi:hypothetical protein